MAGKKKGPTKTVAKKTTKTVADKEKDEVPSITTELKEYVHKVILILYRLLQLI